MRYGSPQVSTIYTPTNQYWVMMELLPEYQRDPAALGMLYVRGSSGKLVPLNAVAKLTRTVGPLTVNHLGQLPAVTISFNLKPGVALGDAVAEVKKMEQELRLPATLSTSFQGTVQAFQRSLQGLGLLILAAILLIYLILGILYESFLHPLTILSGLPSAGVGALLTLILFNQELNLYGFVGIIMLVGIVKKNAIMMIDFAIDAQRAGKPAVRGDLPGLPPALPPDHDDDHGRPHGDAAHRRRHRRGGRCAPEPRPGRGRRPRALAAPDALHHPRHLPLPGSRPRAARPPARPARSDECGGTGARARRHTSSPS